MEDIKEYNRGRYFTFLVQPSPLASGTVNTLCIKKRKIINYWCFILRK